MTYGREPHAYRIFFTVDEGCEGCARAARAAGRETTTTGRGPAGDRPLRHDETFCTGTDRNGPEHTKPRV
jgi:hypothetical protein